MLHVVAHVALRDLVRDVLVEAGLDEPSLGQSEVHLGTHAGQSSPASFWSPAHLRSPHMLHEPIHWVALSALQRGHRMPGAEKPHLGQGVLGSVEAWGVS